MALESIRYRYRGEYALDVGGEGGSAWTVSRMSLTMIADAKAKMLISSSPARTMI